MRRLLLPASILLIALFFALASWAIVRIKTTELSFQLERNQLFNYELSSRMLRARFEYILRSQDDFSTEIKMNVLESGVLNFRGGTDLTLKPLEYVGLLIVNGVRKLTFKPFLSLQDDQGRLMLLQYAFYLERTRNYAEAVKKYSMLEDRLKGNPQDHGFVLLHKGFCLALMGNTGNSLAVLKEVRADYPGSRNARDAEVLIAILEELQRREIEIKRQHKSEKAQAVAFTRNGQYAIALKKFEKAKNLTVDDKYYRARSYEGVGKTQKAVGEYIALVGQSQNTDVAKRANRRLLMIGNFYQGGEKVKKIAEENARKIGDEQVVQEVKKGAELQLKPTIIEKIKEQKEKKGSAEGQAMDEDVVRQLEEIRKDVEETLVRKEKRLDKIVASAAPIKEPPKKIKMAARALPHRISIRFRDGREVFGQKVECDGTSMIIQSGQYSITVPYAMLSGMSLKGGGGGKTRLRFTLTDGSQIRGDGLIHRGGKIYIKNASGEGIYPEDYLKKAEPTVK